MVWRQIRMVWKGKGADQILRNLAPDLSPDNHHSHFSPNLKEFLNALHWMGLDWNDYWHLIIPCLSTRFYLLCTSIFLNFYHDIMISTFSHVLPNAKSDKFWMMDLSRAHYKYWRPCIICSSNFRPATQLHQIKNSINSARWLTNNEYCNIDIINTHTPCQYFESACVDQHTGPWNPSFWENLIIWKF